ncbi:hypothetical protein KQX54_010620 [Cotesia glomerata]|uniref:Guanylate kinase-like domain-containing protein n=1 Tax=Cotesia glomerata TaxID=32391 RepID=A0AAV7IK36_COTGL|nr:hypothetical protein KQX54_010620 [Cotesia glomerata]
MCHNNISSLKFLRDVHCLRLIDLKDNAIEDLMEVFHLDSLIYEIDLRNNPCTKWPNYKEIVLFSIPSAVFVDGSEVTESEMVSATITFNPPINLLASRGATQLTLLEQLNVPKIDDSMTSYDENSPPLIILSGPLAVKKLALGRHLFLKNSDKIKYCRSHTTRKNFTNNIENDGFYFVNHEEFHEMARNGEFLTIEEILGDSYGLHVSELVKLKKEKKIGITQLDLLATIQIKIRYPQVKLILVFTKNEEMHRQWIEDKLRIFRWIKNSSKNLWALSIHREYNINNVDSMVNKMNIVSTISNRVDVSSSYSSEIQYSNSKRFVHR